MTRKAHELECLNGHERHNRNCYAYLLRLKPHVDETLIRLIPELASVQSITPTNYHASNPYGDLYSTLISSIEDRIQTLYSNPSHAKHLDPLIYAIYHNNNGILDDSQWLVQVSDKASPSRNTSKHIKQELHSKSVRVNKNDPRKQDSFLGKFNSVFSSNFKPQQQTNIPSLKNYRYKKIGFYPMEYRFSTQAQRHQNKERVSPLFKKWLEINAAKAQPGQEIAHVYFNNLTLDSKGMDIEAVKERSLSLKLHELEGIKELKVAVITLPASKGIMNASNCRKIHKNLSYRSVFRELLQIAYGHRAPNKIHDLWISPAILNKVFGEENNRVLILRELLKKSFEEYGISSTDSLSIAQKQAVWVHFTKYELTNYLLTKLNPISFNFSCKDAIDRGAVSSAYYNLMKSFEVQSPLGKEEFISAIESAAASVKARGMNQHRKVIWNALDFYIYSHYSELMADEHKSWLIYWRDMNCPPICARSVLNLRIAQCRKALEALPTAQDAIKKSGLAVLSTICTQLSKLDSKILLEIVSNTAKLISHPSKSTFKNYKEHAERLSVKNQAWTITAGLMKIFLGALLYLPTFGYSHRMITRGISDTRSGFFAPQKKELASKMTTFSRFTLLP